MIARKQKHVETVPVKQVFLAELERQKRRTGVGSIKLLKGRDDVPEGLTHAMIEGWCSGAAKRAQPGYMSYVLKAYRRLASISEERAVYLQKVRNRRNRAHYTKIDHKRLLVEKERTQVTAGALLAGRDDIPDLLTPERITSWLNGWVDETDPAHIEYVFSLYAALPDANLVLDISLAQDDRLVEIGPDMLDRLRVYKQSGLLPSKAFKFIAFDPRHPGKDTVVRWLSGKAKSLRLNEYEFVLHLCEELTKRGFSGP